MAGFSIELFDALGVHGFPRVHSRDDLVSGRKLAMESFPTSAWRALGLKPLPGKSRTSAVLLGTWTTALAGFIPCLLVRTAYA